LNAISLKLLFRFDQRGRKIVRGLVRLLTVFSLLFLGCLAWLGTPQIAQAANLNNFALPSISVLAVEGTRTLRNPADAKLADVYGEKIDLNNTNVRAFQKYPGFSLRQRRGCIKNSRIERTSKTNPGSKSR
jgi:photosystem II PsbU protein